MANPTPAKTLIIVASELLQALPAEELPQGAQVLRLVHGLDPITQIKAALQARESNPVEVLRIISHGEPGAIVLAGQRITAADLKARSPEVKQWSQALAARAEILLYGCAVASTAAGQLLAHTLAQLTGADVAASVDTTGAGGNLRLAYATGPVASSPMATQAAWDASGLSLALPNQRPGSGAVFSAGSGIEFPNSGAFAALSNKGEIQVWGFAYYGGDQVKAPKGGGYTAIYSNGSAFAALNDKGEIQVWGNTFSGGDQAKAPKGGGYTAIYSNASAFAALNDKGEIQVWGDTRYGGDQAKAPKGGGYTAIYSNASAFAALNDKGEIQVWGDTRSGGDQAKAPKGGGYTTIYSNGSAFAALNDKGEIQVWGNTYFGGDQAKAPKGGGYTAIYSNASAFAARNDKGEIQVWGDTDYGGNQAKAPKGGGYTAIYSNGSAFAALNDKGEIQVWGYTFYGGDQAKAPKGGGYTAIYSNASAFAALNDKGEIQVWGDTRYGGDQAKAPKGGGYTAIYSNASAFAALNDKGEIQVWGDKNTGGDQVVAPRGSGYTSISSIYTLSSTLGGVGGFAALGSDGSIATWGAYIDSKGKLQPLVAPSGTDFVEIQTVMDTRPSGPTVKISSTLSSLGNGQVAVLSFELSVSSSNFTLSDVSVSNGSLSALQQVTGSNGRRYTATFTPMANTKADAKISVAAGSFNDAADPNKTNRSATSFTLPIDTTPPALVSLALAGNGQVLNLVMSQPLANGLAGAPALPPSSAFALQADGQAVAINAIAANGTSLSLTLAAPIAESVKQLTLTYTDPSSGDDAAALQDLAGQDAAGFTGVLSNQAPILSRDKGTNPDPTYTEQSSAVRVIAGALKLVDSDSTAIATATVQISSGLTTGDLLSVTTTDTPILARYDATSGTLTLVGQASAATYQQVLSSISFSNSTDAPTSLSSQRSLSISVRDNGGSGLAAQTSAPLVVSFNVLGVNDGVTLNPAALNPSVTVKAGAAAPVAGQLPSGAIKVSDLVRTGSGGNVTDPDGDQIGIAITGIASGFTPHYSTNNGATWQAEGTVKPASARLLWADDTTWLYLQPTTKTLTTTSTALTYRAWDRNTPSTVTTPYVNGQGSVNTGSGSTSTSPSPFSSAIDTLSVTVAGNASPTLVTGLQGSLNPIPANSTAPQKGEIGRGTLVRDLIRDSKQSTPRDLISDIDSQDARGIAITAVASGLELHFSSDNGANWTKATNTVSPTSALLLLADATTRVQLVSASPSNTASTVPEALTFKAWDGNGSGLINGKQGVNSNQTHGVVGFSPFSPTTTTASLLLQQQNQAPSAALPGGKVLLDMGSNTGDNARSVVTQSDGKILIAGSTSAQPAVGQFISDNYGVVRLKADGSLDTSFGTGGKALLDLGTNSHDQATSIVTQSDGKILIAGFTNAQPAAGTGNFNNYGVVRLKADGSLDTSFGTGGKALLDLGIYSSDVAYSVVTQSDGKILIAGYTSAQPAGGYGNANYGVVRLNPDGTVDTTYGSGGKALLDLGTNSRDEAYSVVTQADGKILLAGGTDANLSGARYKSNNYGVVRLKSDGSLDRDFGTSGSFVLDLGTLSFDVGYSVVTQSDGKILIAGFTNAQPSGAGGSSNNYSVVRLKADGSLDTDFGTAGKVLIDLGSGTYDQAFSVVTQSDGKILIAGFTNAQQAAGTGNFNNYGVVRLKADGSLDTSFGTGGKALLDLGTNSNDEAYSMVMQSDGKILIAGTTNAQPAGGTGSSNNYGVVRLNADGSLDSTFNPPTSLDGKASYLIAGAAVALDNQVAFSDPQLAALNNGAGNYNGARLVLQRDGGANPGDVFSALNNLQLETATASAPGRIVLGSTTPTSSPLAIGSWSQTNGTLELLFNSNASQAAVNETASSIGYRFTGNTPPANSIQIRWTFSDGNSGSQGLGGELGTSGITQVTISAPPVDRTSSATLVSTTSLAVPTTAISAATAATVFELRLTDNDANADGIPNGGSSDGQSTLVNAISVSLTSPGSAYLAYQLRGPDLSAPVAGTLSSNGTSLQFDLSATPLSIANNSSETYSVEAWYASGSVVDGANLVTLSLNPLQQISLGAEGSQFNSPSQSLSRQLTGSVVATTFKILAPAQVVSGKANSFTVQAVDANGNLDKDATGSVSLQLAKGSGTFSIQGDSSGAQPTAVIKDGAASFSNLVYRASADGEAFSLQATGSEEAGGLSGLSAAITADVVATRLEIQGKPSATALQSGQNSTINGLSVVAVDQSGVIDRDWLGAGLLQLSLGAPNQSPLSGTVAALGGVTGDADSDQTTITLNPRTAADSSGRIDLGNLLINYSNATNSPSDSLALKVSLGSSLVASGPIFTSQTSPTANTPPTFTLGTGTAPSWQEAGGVANATAGSGAVTVAATATLADAEQGTLAALDVQITNAKPGDLLALANPASGLTATFDTSSGLLSIRGSASVADYQAALRAVTYSNSSDNPDPTPRSITITASDGQAQQSTRSTSLTLAVTPANDAPTLGAPASVTATEDLAAALNLSALSVGDGDGEDTTLTLRLGVQQAAGSLKATDGAGVAVSRGRGNSANSELVLQGTASAINAYLQGSNPILFNPTRQRNGAVSLSYSLSDGSSLAPTTGSTTITVAAVNDAAEFSGVPTGQAPAHLRHGVATGLQSLIGATPMTLADSDLADYAATTQVTLDVTNATLGGLSSGSYSGATLTTTSASSWQVVGPLTAINALLASNAITLQSTTPGAVSLSLTANDGSNTAGSTTTIAIQFLAVSDPLINNSFSSPNAPRTISTGFEESLSFLTITDLDAGSNPPRPQTFTLTISEPASGGLLYGLKDAESSSGIQLKGTAAEINQQLGDGRFKALADGATSLQLSLSNGVAPALTSTVNLSAVNTPPGLTTVGTLSGGQEDGQLAISFADLSAAADDSDKGGSVEGFVVKAITSGTLLIGTTADAATAWAAGINDRINPNRSAYWTPASNANGTGNNALAAFTVVALDNSGAESSTPVPVTVDVAAVNDAPSLSGIPSSATAVTTAQSSALADFTVADRDSSSLTLTLEAVNGSIGNLTDADTSRAGIQLTGSASTINAAVANATFNATTNGAASISLRLEDGGNEVAKATYGLLASKGNSAPSLASQSSPRLTTSGMADSISYISVSDLDEGQTLSLSLNPSGGSFRNLADADPNASGIQLRGTVDEINTALDRGSFVTSAVGNASIAVAASDGIASPVSFTYTLIASNLAPTLRGTISLSGLTEDLASTITYKDLLAASAAADSNGSVTGFKVTAVDGSKGSLKIAGANWVSGTNDTIDADRAAEWMPAANLNGTLTAALSIEAIDDLGDLSTASSVDIAVAAVNDAPSLSGNASFANTTEDEACTAIRVRDLLNGNSPSRSASDISNETASTDLGLAIIASSGLGTWQYTSDPSISNSTVWQSVGSVSAQSSLLLSAGTWLRYLPDPVNTPVGGETGIGITYRSWDTSESTAGSRVDTSINGGSSAFSTTTATATLTVSSVDDPLTLSLSRETTTSNNITAAAVTYQELDLDGISGNDLQLLDSGLSLNDPDSSQTRSAVKLLINSGLVSAEDRLELQGSTTPSSAVVNGDTILTSTLSLTAAGTTATVTAKYNQTNGVLDLSTTTSQSEAFWQQVLRNVGYRNSSDTPTTTLNGQPRVVQVEMLADSMFVRRDANGLPHFYEYVISSGISWTSAKTAAAARIYNGMTGYLATITDSAENNYLYTLLPANAWIGASDAASQGASEGNWEWVTGPEAGTRFWNGAANGSVVGNAYANWASGEPNNQGDAIYGGFLNLSVVGYEQEDYAQIRSANGKWNDLEITNSPGGYLVEYSSPSVTDITFSKTFGLSIQAGNDAPVLSSASPSLILINEDNLTSSGQLLSSFIASSTITDPDGGSAPEGVAITSLGSGNGTWQYSLNNSGSWLAMGSLSSNQSLLLRDSDAVRFLPDGENATSASFTYHAWDQSSGTAGSLVTTTETGGSTAFSVAYNTASISVTAVNDAPSWTLVTPAIDLGTIAGGDSSNAGVLVSALVARGSDPDHAASALGAALVGLNESVNSVDIGDWQVSTNGGGTWTALSGVSIGSARLLAPTDRLRFAPTGAVGGTVSLDLRLWDRTTGSAGSSVDLSSGASSGGSTAYSSASRSVSVTASGISLSGVATSASLTEGGSLTPGSSISLSAGTLSSARVLIASGLSAGDALAYTPPSGSPITASYDASTGELLLSGSANSTEYQAALQAVTLTVGDDPTQFNSKRQIAFLLENQTSSSAYTTVTVTATPDAPVLSAAPAATYTEGASAVALHPSLSLSDADDLQIASATVTITAGRITGDLLTFAGANGSPIAGSYNSGTGVLTLSGTATLAEYQTALRSITFENSTSNPTNSGAAPSRTISFAVSDANSDGLGAASASSVVTLNVTAINSAPALGAGLERSYIEGGTPVSLDPGSTITITDGDDTNLSGAVLEILPSFYTSVQGQTTLNSGYSSGDQLALPSAPGGITSSWDATSGRLTLSGNATIANYQTALRAVTFSSSSADPTATTNRRRISISVSDANRDGNGAVSGQATSNQAGVDITITPTANAPVVTITNATTPTFTEAGSAVALASASALSLSDVDDSQLTKAVVSISSGFTSGDRLAYTPVTGITGNYDKALGQLTFAGPASLADYELLLRSITYSNDTAALGSGSRTISWTVLDADSDGLTPQWSTAATSTVTVTGINQAPTLAVVSLRGSYVENDAATVVQEGITLSDLDSTQLSGATVSITQGFMAGDTLALASSSSGITANYNSSTGVLSLTGVASISAYQMALGAITYSSTSDDPTAGNTVNARTLTWQVTDQDNIPVTSVASTSTLQVVRVNDNPTLTAFAPANPAAPAIVSGGEDQAIPVTYAALIGTGAAKAQVADVDGTVIGLKVFELLSGSLRLGSSASAALDYVAGSNDTITSTINAYWTPSANGNGTAANALEAFSVVAVDDFGALSIAPRSVWVDVNPDRADGAQISKLLLPANGIYTTGQSLDFSVVFDRAVSVATSSGTPTLPITLNSGSGAAAEYRSGSGTSTLVFRYTVRAGDSDSNGLAVGSAIALNGGAITSLDDGQPVVSSLTLPGISSTEGLLVDGVNDAPEVSSPTLLNARYSEGDAAIRLNPDLALSDSDSSSFSIATVRISAGFTAGDGLALSSEVSTDTGVVASWNANTGTLTLTPSTDPNAAAPTLLHALRALRAVTFASSSDHPTGTSTSRTVEWQVSDNAQASSNLASGSFTITPVNDAPTFSLLSTGLVRTHEDTAAEISVQTLAGVSNASDIDGVVTAYVVKAVTSGRLKLGSTAQSATDWVAGSNDVIDLSTKAFWTPERDVNGNGISAFTVVARDNGGSNALTSSTPVAVTVDVTPVADIAQITSFQMPAPGTYGPGSVLQFAISFDRAISLNSAGGVPSLSLQFDGNRSVDAVLQAPQTTYAAGDSLSFAYTVVDGDLRSSAGIGLPTSVSLPDGSSLTNIDSGVSVAVNPTLPAAHSSGLLVDGVRPLLLGIKEAPGSESNRAEQTFRVSFSEPVRNVDATDFRLTATGSASGLVSAVQSVNAINGVANTYDVTVGGIGGLGRLVLELDRTGTAIADAVGNPIVEGPTASGSMEVDRVGAISRVAGDDRLNVAEASKPELKIKGTVSQALAGQTLNLWLSSGTLTSTPLATVSPIVALGDGSWSAVVPKASLDPFGTENYTLTLMQSITPLGSRDLAIDRNPPTLSDPTNATANNPSLIGGVLNKAEIAGGLTIKGTTDAEAGQQVDGRLGSINATGMVSNGTWDVQFTDIQLQTLRDGSLNLALAVSDLAGNPTTANYTLTLDTTAQVNLAAISNDGWINTAESSQALTISGAAEGVQDGAAVNLAITFINSSGASTNFYSASGLLSAGAFSFNVPQGQNWVNGTTYNVTVSGSDAAGNPFSDTKTVTVDTEAPTVDLQLAVGSSPTVGFLDASFAGQFAGMSNTSATLNAEELAAGVLLSSSASADASTTLVSVNGSSQLVAPSTSNGGTSWSVVLNPERFSLPEEGAVIVSATVTDQAGNSASQSGTLQVDRAATVSISAPVDGVGGNHVLNALEAEAVTLSGTVGRIQVDSSASVSIEVLAKGGSTALINHSVAPSSSNWSAPSLDFSGLADGQYIVRTRVSDGAGNRASASQAFGINTAPPVFTSTAFAGDSILNGSEFSSSLNPSLSGLVSNAEDGQPVSVTLPGAGSVAGRTLSATVDGGIWSLVIPSDLLAAYGAENGTYTVNLSLTNQAGNTATSTTEFTVDTVAPVVVLVNSPTEAQWGAAALNPTATPFTLSGTVQGLEAGQPVVVTINDKELQATRESGNPSQWSLVVPKAVLKSIRAFSNSLEVAARDRAGNSAVLANSFDAPGVPTLRPIIAVPTNRQVLATEGDGLIRQFQANQPVSWSLGGIDPNLVVINPGNGSLSFRKPISLSDGQDDWVLPFVLIATDARGNQTTEDLVLVVRNLPDGNASASVDPLDEDGIAATVEDAATNGRPGITAGDLNNDGISDKLQPNVAAVPWINKENFVAATADPSQAAANGFTSLQSSPSVRIAGVEVRKAADLAVGGNGSSGVPALITTSTLQTGGRQQASVSFPYDPLVFRLQSYDALTQEALTSFIDLAPALADGSDPYPGTQVRLVMDLPGDGLLINTYLKWNPSANSGVGGWFEFLADGDANTDDNGAELVDLNGDGRIDQIRLTYTDGDPLGGDIDGLVNGIIEDPGMPGLLAASGQAAPVSSTDVDIVKASGSITVKASFYGGSLVTNSAITINTPSNLDPLSALGSIGANDPGFTINGNTISFDLDLQAGQSQASLYGDLNLVGSDLSLTGSSGKRRLAYYGFNNGAALSLIYDPLKKAGARFYDRSGDGIVDFLALAMVNGGYGDLGSGGAGDQLISNSSAAAIVDGAVASLTQVVDDTRTLTVADASVNAAPVNVVLKASLSKRSSTANQIGYLVLDSTELGNVLTIGEMKDRAQTLFSTLESSDLTLPADPSFTGFQREILVVNGQSVRFFEVSDGSLDDIQDSSDSRLRFFSLAELSAQQAFLVSTSGVQFQLDVMSSDQGLNALIGQEQGHAAVLDFSTFSGSETVTGSLVLAREASYDSITGFYRTLDREGSVRDALGAILRPGDAGYSAAATYNLVSGLSSLQVGNMRSNVLGDIAITESSFLAPMAMVNGDTYFAFAAASSDKLNHFKVLGNNLFGLEDMRGLGDRDYDDLVIGFKFNQLS